LGKCFELVTKKTNGLGYHDKVPKKLIPSTFSKEMRFFYSDNLVMLKHHCTKCYIQIRKELLDYLEDWMTQDSLIGKNGSNVSKMSTPSIKSMDSKSSNPFDFYPKHLIHAFTPFQTLKDIGEMIKKQYENVTDQFEGNPEQSSDGLLQYLYECNKGKSNG
jgi:hypothetical protein